MKMRLSRDSSPDSRIFTKENQLQPQKQQQNQEGREDAGRRPGAWLRALAIIPPQKTPAEDAARRYARA